MEDITRTKIICTLSNFRGDKKFITDLIQAGMNVVRLNFSHMKRSDALPIINNIRTVRDELNKPIAIMLDTKGPEVRIYGHDKLIQMKNDSLIKIKSYSNNDIYDKIIDDENLFLTNLGSVGNLVEIGQNVLIMDGYIDGSVISKTDNEIDVKINSGGDLRPKAHLSLPGIEYPIPFLSQKDIEDITFAVEEKIEYIALSFVRSPDDIFQVRALIKEIDPDSDLKIISKIENKQSIDNLDDIIRYSDGAMVARGDLGVELPLQDVPIMQKKIIRLCYMSGKPVITATQMLETMIDNRIPTRAEASDVANACYDMTSAVMLSGETAIGKYPILVVETMKKIINKVENEVDYSELLYQRRFSVQHRDQTAIISYNAVSTAYQSKAAAILVFTKMGHSAKMISKLRPGLPIYAFTPSKKVFHQLAINWGIQPKLATDLDNFELMLENEIQSCIKMGFLKKGDLIVIVAGLPLGVRGRTNMIRIENIGKNRIPCDIVSPGIVTAPLVIIDNETELAEKDITQKIVLLKKFRKQYAAKLKYALGIVMEIGDAENDLQTVGFAFDIPIAINATNASEIFNEGSVVRIDSDKKMILEL